MVQKVAVSRELEARLRHATTGKVSLSTQQKMGTFLYARLKNGRIMLYPLASVRPSVCPSVNFFVSV